MPSGMRYCVWTYLTHVLRGFTSLPLNMVNCVWIFACVIADYVEIMMTNADFCGPAQMWSGAKMWRYEELVLFILLK